MNMIMLKIAMSDMYAHIKNRVGSVLLLITTFAVLQYAVIWFRSGLLRAFTPADTYKIWLLVGAEFLLQMSMFLAISYLAVRMLRATYSFKAFLKKYAFVSLLSLPAVVVALLVLAPVWYDFVLHFKQGVMAVSWWSYGYLAVIVAAVLCYIPQLTFTLWGYLMDYDSLRASWRSTSSMLMGYVWRWRIFFFIVLTVIIALYSTVLFPLLSKVSTLRQNEPHMQPVVMWTFGVMVLSLVNFFILIMNVFYICCYERLKLWYEQQRLRNMY